MSFTYILNVKDKSLKVAYSDILFRLGNPGKIKM